MGGKGGGGGDITQADYLPGGQYHSVMQQMHPELTSDPTSPFYDAPPPAAAAAPAPAPAPAAAPAAVEAPAPAAPAGDPGPAKNDTLAPSIPGGGTDAADPAAPGGAGSGVTTAGSTLGGAILNPPKYWTGNANKFKSGSASQGKMTTTQT